VSEVCDGDGFTSVCTGPVRADIADGCSVANDGARTFQLRRPKLPQARKIPFDNKAPRVALCDASVHTLAGCRGPAVRRRTCLTYIQQRQIGIPPGSAHQPHNQRSGGLSAGNSASRSHLL
jgi:hypothetical protein